MQRDDALRQLLADRLAAWPCHAPDESGLKRAAVALVVTDEGTGAGLDGVVSPPQPGQWSSRAALILTKRAAHLRRHAGQWALPGGRIDNDETPEQTALRELAEEVGLQLSEADVLGRLDTFITRSGFAMTPVVVWAGEARLLVPDPTEVASIHRIPVSEFLRADAPILELLEGSEQPVLKMPLGDNWIAAPTAALIYQFREVCLLGRATRVAHFEQPKFAWT
ncbi:MAG: CoA pyrophosphatase [Microbacteriaceae bacterium]|nr:CoA pyrophosphatase [Burkholderiaceae bacterium]